ncbi:MAG: Stk1 family PASTA domain-containing Ser/Thr kinase [Bacillota bacterium]
MIESGRLLGNRYKLVEKVGEGGMARVFRGVDLKLNRPVAVKILYEQFAADPEFLRRFQQEAKAAAKLSHPSIVNVYDEGEEDNVHYFVMEFVEGYTLKEIIQREGRLHQEEAAQITYLVCDALDSAHSQNVIHRDIKPQNIIITPEGRVKVADFGIARAASGATITHGRSLLGSVYYSSPEQARGSNADQQSDIYSLGIVLYEMLTGTVPFSGESPISVALKHLQEDIVPPGEHVPGLSPGLEKILARAVHKDLRYRYKSSAEFRDELERWLKDEQKNNRETSLVSRTQYNGLKRIYRDVEEPEQDDEGEGRRFPTRKLAVAVVLLLAVFVALLAAYRILPGLLVVPEVTVPDLAGMNLAAAEKELEGRGLGSRVTGEIHSNHIPPNHIVSQDPPAGRSVRKERIVELTISAGPQFVEIPSLVGRTEREARLLLTDLGLEMEIQRDFDEEIASGYIIRQDPGQGFRLTRGETVLVVVSEGKKPFTLRNFQGWALSDVREWLNLYGLILRDVKEEFSNEFEQGQVISQSPSAGETIRPGDAVDLVISKGRDTSSYPVYSVNVHPAVSVGKVIKIVVQDMEGEKIIFEGVYAGQAFTARGVGSGRVVLMEFRDNEYYTIDTKQFP